MASYQPAATADDGMVWLSFGSPAFGNTGSVFLNQGGFISPREVFIRFPVDFSAGASIESATLTLTSAETRSVVGSPVVWGGKQVDSPQIASKPDFDSRPLTTASVSFTPGDITEGQQIVIDVKTIIEELVAQPGFTGHVQLFLKVGTLAGNSMALFVFESNNNTPANIPTLSVVWTAGGGGGGAVPTAKQSKVSISTSVSL